MKYISTVLIFILASCSVHAQLGNDDAVCGLSAEQDALLIKRTRAAINYIDAGLLDRSDATRYLPVVFHAMHRTDGSGGVSTQIAETAICNLNDYYKDFGTNIQFYLTETNHVFNTTAYEDHWNSGEDFMLGIKQWDKINIYVPSTANFDPNSIYNVAGYYSPGADWIVLGPGNLTGSTIAHEVGHYLGLPHPFRGWDHEPYNPTDHGVQVGPNAPGSFGQNIIPNEKMDGSNCNQAGDLICDTPPDYNHYGPNWGCNYTGGAKDPNGDLIDPDEQNVMAYFLGCNTKIMSQGQQDVINADVNLRIAQNNLYELQNPNPGEVGETTTVAPLDMEVIEENWNIYFEWEAAANAESYELWIDWVPTFTLAPIILTTDENSLVFDGIDLLEDRKYYWKVKPVHSFELCTEFTPNSTFYTSILSGLKDAQGPEQLLMYPNPAKSGTTLSIDWPGHSAQVNWEVRNMQGTLIRRFESPDGRTEVDTDLWPAGIYWIKGDSSERQALHKFIIQ